MNQLRITTDEYPFTGQGRYRVDNGSDELRPGGFLITLQVLDESALEFDGDWVDITDPLAVLVIETGRVL